MKPEKTVSAECRLLDELVDDAAAKSPAAAQTQPPGKAEATTLLLPELKGDAALPPAPGM